ncbi:MAG: hypothetical protein BWZ04_03283 [Firmicutes bacterium ADurb.BinA205]|nr:MAG: hypothetical protein BWZ04_03283 [Firmicutes bacterium ADurb.BinA205]
MLNQPSFGILFDLFQGHYTNKAVGELDAAEIIFSSVYRYFRFGTPIPASVIFLKMLCILAGADSEPLLLFHCCPETAAEIIIVFTAGRRYRRNPFKLLLNGGIVRF